MIEEVSVATVTCKYCGSADVMRYGVRKGEQQYLCRACGRKFANNGALPKHRVPPEQVGAAVSMYYGGLSANEVRRNFQQMYGFTPSSKTVYKWIVDYTKAAKRTIPEAKPKIGDTWVADEVFLKVGGDTLYLWDVMDAKTRFLLATRIAVNRGAESAEAVMNQAEKVAGKTPKRIITDRLKSYIDGIERAFGADTKHVQSGGIRAETNNNLMERLQGSIRQREKVMRGLKTRETAQTIMDGWTLHYNYFRPHESLKGSTPAKAAGVAAPVKDWGEVARMDVRSRFPVPALKPAPVQQAIVVSENTPERDTLPVLRRHPRARRRIRRGVRRPVRRRTPRTSYYGHTSPSLSIVRTGQRRR